MNQVDRAKKIFTYEFLLSWSSLLLLFFLVLFLACSGSLTCGSRRSSTFVLLVGHWILWFDSCFSHSFYLNEIDLI